MSERPASDTSLETATLAGGCFWCTETVFSELRGVHTVMPGYAGGEVPSPTYEQVCTGRTGHAEAVQIEFDPKEISYAELLQVFFSTHDPTTKNRQGADVGTQYRSAIFTHDAAQAATAREVARSFESDRLWSRPIVTEIVPYSGFYPAEEYHREYFRKNPTAGYCQMVIAPKIAKFRKQFVGQLKGSAR